jgi:hypothetical protein
MVEPLKDTRKEKYKGELIKCGFNAVVINGDEKPQCVMRCELLENEPREWRG